MHFKNTKSITIGLLIILLYAILSLIIYQFLNVSMDAKSISPFLTLIIALIVWEKYVSVKVIRISATQNLRQIKNKIVIKFYCPKEQDIESIILKGDNKHFILKINSDNKDNIINITDYTIVFDWKYLNHNKQALIDIFSKSDYIQLILIGYNGEKYKSNKFVIPTKVKKQYLSVLNKTNGYYDEEQLIRKLAYDLHKKHNNQSPEENWIRAEKIVQSS